MMHTRSNLHTHSRYCDGSSTLPEMADAAVEAGFSSLGFSGHSWFPWGEGYTMTPDRTAQYVAEISALQTKYEGRLTIFCGLENDFARLWPTAGLDYVIGASHCVPAGDGWREVDDTPEKLCEVADVWYGGDRMRVVRAYYERVVQYAQQGGFDILAHFDLITKFQQKAPLFDDASPDYRELALSALDAVIDTGVILEVNTGAMSRGWRTEPYPAPFLLKRMRERNAPVIISADAHHRDHVAAYFDETEALLRSVGYTEQMELTREGFVPVSLTD